MSTPHFSSTGPSSPFLPLISPMSEATPNTLHDGYSLQASVNTGLPDPPPSFFRRNPPGPPPGAELKQSPGCAGRLTLSLPFRKGGLGGPNFCGAHQQPGVGGGCAPGFFPTPTASFLLGL